MEQVNDSCDEDMAASKDDIARHTAQLKNKLAALDRVRLKIAAELSTLENKHDMGAAESSTPPRVTMASAAAEKVALQKPFPWT